VNITSQTAWILLRTASIRKCELRLSNRKEGSDVNHLISWAIRNCGLLLIRSLIDCLFGTSESKVVTESGWDGRSIRLSYDRYPALPELLMKLLTVESRNAMGSGAQAIGTVESVFPALDIIRRAGPPPRHRDEIFSIVAKHLESKIWHMRDIAARTICTLLLHGNWLSDVEELLDSYTGSANQLHGMLLSIRYLLDRRLDMSPEKSSGRHLCSRSDSKY